MTLNLSKNELQFLISKFNEISVKGFDSAQNYIAVGTVLYSALQEQQPAELSDNLVPVFKSLFDNMVIQGKEAITYIAIKEKIENEQK